MYLTPASISYLTQFILSASIVGILTRRYIMRRDRSVQSRLLIGFFLAIALFIALLFLEAASMPTQRLKVVFLENPALAIALVFLLQFAYRLPVLLPKWKRETNAVLGLSLIYMLWESGFAVFRFVRLQAGVVLFRNNFSDYALLLLLLWAPLVFLRQYVFLTTAGGQSWRDKLVALLRPRGTEAHAAGLFALVYFFVAGLSIFNILHNFYLLSASLASMGISLGILLALFAFSLTYLTHQKEGISYLVKLAGTILLVMLALLGVVGWVVSPFYETTYHAVLPDYRTLRFTPNEAGGYDIAELSFSFQTGLGSDTYIKDGPLDLHLSDTLNHSCSSPLDFDFLFYGQNYEQVYACNDGTVSMGQPVIYRDYQYRYGTGIPLIMALLTDLYPEVSPGGVFVLQDSDRLVVTWDRQRNFYRQGAEYTFQLILYHNGVFDLSYNGLPAAASPLLAYYPNDEPGASAWAIGAVPGGSQADQPPQSATLTDLPLQTGPDGVVQDYLLEFRSYLNQMFAPLAWLILAASLFVMAGFPLMIYVNLIKPLEILLTGVQQLDEGHLDVQLPVHQNDEVGSLTQSFNSMAIWLRSLVANLELRVAARTSELSTANTRLQKEMDENKAAQKQVMEQQRQLAALEERERLGRDLHDGLGQVMGSITVQTQAAQAFLARGQVEATRVSMERVVDMSQDAQASVRDYILGLREPSAPAGNLFVVLQASLHEFTESTGIQAALNLPAGRTLPSFPPAVEEQILHIIQESLTNIRKHASAQRVEILFSFDPDQAQVIISDDGVGFDARYPVKDKKNHLGLGMMRERAEMVGGRLDVRSAPGLGTKVLLTIPRLAAMEENDARSVHGLRILLVDDSPIFLEGLRNLLMARGLAVIGLAHDGLEAQEKARLLRPDVIVMDVRMPNCDGLEATRLIKAEFPEIRIVMLTVSEDDDFLFEAIKNGASGYLLKSLDANEFCNLLTGLTRGEAPLTPGMATRLLDELAHPSGQSRSGRVSDVELSKRQWQILELVASNRTYKEVATTLGLSETTIKYHMGQILASLHLENRAQAVAYVRRVRMKDKSPDSDS